MGVRLYTGDDGQSHFEDMELPAGDVETVAIKDGAGMTFRRAEDGQLIGSIEEEINTEDSDKQAFERGKQVGNLDWHNAPRRQYVIVLSCQMEFQVGDGTVRRLGPGDILLAEDLTGQGHITRAVGGPLVWVTVPLPD